MRRLAALACASALAPISGAAPAAATHWPVAGGDPSRSGLQAAEAGATPIELAWFKGTPGVRTPMVITGGAGPGVQRVAYGTNDGVVQLRVLATGAFVGAEGGNLVDGGIRTDDPSFGSDTASVGFADTSTPERLGQLLVVHNDDNSVQVARIDLATGVYKQSDDLQVPSTLGCEIASSPVLTPRNADGGRVLFFVLAASPSCPANTSLVRIPIEGDALLGSAPFGEVTFAPVDAPTRRASPSLVVLADPTSGKPRFFVGIGRLSGVAFYPADTAFGIANPAPPAVTPAITAQVETGEIAQTPVAAATAEGLVAGSEGSGTPRAAALYVATETAGETRVYRFVQDGAAAVLRAAPAPARLPDGSGPPAPGMALAESATASGGQGDGRLAVATAANLHVLRSENLVAVGRPLSAAPLGPGDGFVRNVPAVSGSLLYIQSDGAGDRAPQHLVRTLEDPQAALGGFAAAPGNAPGPGFGQPAISRGFVVFGSAAGVFAYRNRDVTPPMLDMLAPPASTPQRGTVAVVARAGDARGIASLAFAVRPSKGAVRTIGQATVPESGSPWEPRDAARYSIPLQTASLANGDYTLEATAVDDSGLATTVKRRLRIDNGGDVLRPGACARTKSGTPRADRLNGTARGDRLLGGRGADRIRGGRGDDCLLGQEGADTLDGGPGFDLLDGGPGRDRLKGGPGDDRIESRDKRRDRISCGPGSDRVIADRVDRVSRDCERVRRR